MARAQTQSQLPGTATPTAERLADVPFREWVLAGLGLLVILPLSAAYGLGYFAEWGYRRLRPDAEDPGPALLAVGIFAFLGGLIAFGFHLRDGFGHWFPWCVAALSAFAFAAGAMTASPDAPKPPPAPKPQGEDLRVRWPGAIPVPTLKADVDPNATRIDSPRPRFLNTQRAGLRHANRALCGLIVPILEQFKEGLAQRSDAGLAGEFGERNPAAVEALARATRAIACAALDDLITGLQQEWPPLEGAAANESPDPRLKVELARWFRRTGAAVRSDFEAVGRAEVVELLPGADEADVLAMLIRKTLLDIAAAFEKAGESPEPARLALPANARSRRVRSRRRS